MPYKPMKPCKQQGCPNLTHDTYCEVHAKQEARRYDRHFRNSRHGKRYGSGWQKISAAFLKANPLCDMCRAEGRLTPAELVHHIKPLREGGGNDVENLQALCFPCHSRLHVRRGDCF